MVIRKYYVDKGVSDSAPDRNIRRTTHLEPQPVSRRNNLYVEDRKDLGKDTIYLTYLKGRSLMRCPCSRDSVSCGYFVLDTMVGCPFDCSYCYLQIYQNVRAISVYANLEDKIKSAAKKLAHGKKKIRLGTGEFCDSLTLEDICPQVQLLYFYFKKIETVNLELKTKSDNVSRILKLKPANNFVLSWSLNPEGVVRKEEKYVVSLDQRIRAAADVTGCGWNTGFHFDPIIYYPGWKDDYATVIRKLKKVAAEKIKWISLGTLRFPPPLKNVILERVPHTDIFNYGEFMASFEGKVRYFRKIRVDIYKFMIRELGKTFKNVPVYLCMETPLVWKETFGFIPDGAYFSGLWA